MVLGMCSEISELEEAINNEDKVNIGEELADIDWYVANYRRLRGTSFSKTIIFPESLGVPELYSSVSELQDIVKKYMAYGKVIDVYFEEQFLNEIQALVQGMFEDYGLSQEEYLYKNIAKLQARYPEKFTNEKALNRDLKTERKILEG